MSDLIDRQAAIDALIAECKAKTETYWDNGINAYDIESVLNALPSAQPEEFEWCHDCKEYDQAEHCCHRWTKVIRETVKEIKDAQPERKRGKWEETDDGWDGTYYVCSECGCPWTLIDGTPKDNGMNFCPNCGAQMER